MLSPLFESLVVNNMTLLADEPGDDTAMVLKEADIHAEAESSEEPKFRLDLNDKDLILEELQDLMEYARIGKVKDLKLDKNNLGNAGAGVIASAAALFKLTSLSLGDNRMTDAGAEVLAASPHLKRLKKLYLQGNRIGPAGIDALARSETLQGLELLYLKGNPLGPQGGQALAYSTTLKNLKEVYLGRTRLGLQGLKALCASDLFARTTLLSLADNGLDDSAAPVLAECQALSNLFTLDLNGNPLSKPALDLIRNSPNLKRLKALQVGW